MKNRLILQLIMYSKYTCYALLLQITTMSILCASDGKAQKATSVKEVNISVHLENENAIRAFRKIEALTDFKFSYNKSDLKGINLISGSYNDQSLYHILIDISRQAGIGFKQVNYLISVSKIIKKEDKETSKVEIIEAISVSGTVTSQADGEGLPGVNVVVKGTSNTGTITDVEGNYSLNVPNEDDVLVFSSIGYITQEVPVNGRSEINVALAEDVKSLEEVVVVGYGTQKKSSLTSAVSDIKGEELTKRPISNSRQALQGLAPGVTVTDRGGSPGRENVGIRIRGNTTIGNNEPLVIVDGIEQRFSDLNPNDIESVTVLKDAASTAIYGSRGANGVVLVTTKSAKEGKVNISYDGYYAVQRSANQPKHLGLEAYMRLQNTAYSNLLNGSPIYTEEYIQEYVNATDRLKYPLPNTFFDAIYSPAPQQNHSLSISGGTEQIKSLITVNYFDQDGIIPNYNSERKEVRLDNDIKLSDRIRINTKLNYRRREFNRPLDEGNVFWRLFHSSQWTVPKYPDGTYGVSNQGHNPLMYAEMSGINNNINDYLVANLNGEIEIMKGLTFSTQYGGFTSLTTEKSHANEYEVLDYIDKSKVLKVVTPNSLTENRSRRSRFTLNSLLNYELNLEKNQFHFLAGYSAIRDEYKFLTASRQEFYSNELIVLGAGSDDTQKNNANENEETLRSFFGRFNYSFADKYFFEANARYDGSSRFTGGKNQYSFFPSFSGAWRISQERFWDPVSNIIDELKIRGSWGQTGNNSVGLYAFYEDLNPTSYTFGGEIVNGFIKNSIANPYLTWETTIQTDVGLDAQFFEGRFGLTFDYFKKRTDGILLTLPIPATIGLNAPPQNAGIVDNKGWELALSHRYQRNDFSYAITANVSDVRNKVVDLAGTGPYINGNENNTQTIIKEGLPINAFWGYRALGFFKDENDVAESANIANKNNAFPGDLKYEDVNEDSKINSEDQVMIGSDIPHYSFGLTTDITYKNFDLTFFIQGVGRADAYTTGASIEGGVWEGFTLDIAGDYWTPENRDARFPRPQKRSQKNTKSTSWWIIDASYVKLKNFQLGYTLPAGLSNRMDISSLRFYISGTNLITISKAREWGLDPELPSGRLNYYPQTQVFTLGANLRF